jgi:hypothetical protein
MWMESTLYSSNCRTWISLPSLTACNRSLFMSEYFLAVEFVGQDLRNYRNSSGRRYIHEVLMTPHSYSARNMQGCPSWRLPEICPFFCILTVPGVRPIK